MSRQSLLPGHGFVSETGNRQSLLPGQGFISETAVTSITGTIAVTQAADTMAASGKQTFTGAIAVTQAADTMAASGTFTLSFTGTATMLQAAHTMSATGSVPIIIRPNDDNTSVIFRVIPERGKKKRKPYVIDVHALEEKLSAGARSAVEELFFPRQQYAPLLSEPIVLPLVVADRFKKALKKPVSEQKVVIEEIPDDDYEFEMLMLLA